MNIKNNEILQNIKSNSYFYIRELIKRDPDINIQDDNGYTPALLCCKYGKVLHLDLLITFLSLSSSKLNS